MTREQYERALNESGSKLVFNAAEHRYFVDGQELPSVSSCIEPLSALYYRAEFRMDAARDRGTAVHDAIDLYAEYGWQQQVLEDDLQGYFDAYKAWSESLGKRYTRLAGERMVMHKARIFAGTFDEAGLLDRKPVIVDVKTSKIPVWWLWAVQLTGYAAAIASHYTTATTQDIQIYALHLKGDGTFEFRKLKHETSVFSDCLAIRQYYQRNKEIKA